METSEQSSIDAASVEEQSPPDDRGIPPVNRVRSMQARVSAALAIGVSVLLGGGLFAWYAWGRLPSEAPKASPARKTATSTDSTLPPLSRSALKEQSALESVLGPAPPEPELADEEVTADERPYDERLTQPARTHSSRPSPVFISFGDRGAATASTDPSIGVPDVQRTQGAPLASSLVSTPIPTVRAQRLPDLHLLLPKGSSIDCTLQTAIDTSLPSLVTCIAATDTFSADGSVVLIERGARLFGETRSASTEAGARVFVVWSEVRSGSVVAQLDSPGTDAQGRGGLAGFVDRHFWARFGSAFLVSLIDGGIDAATASRNRNSGIVINPNEGNALLTEVLRSTVDIRPTVGVAPGSRVAVLVARDVDFSSVYELTHVGR